MAPLVKSEPKDASAWVRRSSRCVSKVTELPSSAAPNDLRSTPVAPCQQKQKKRKGISPPAAVPKAKKRAKVKVESGSSAPTASAWNWVAPGRNLAAEFLLATGSLAHLHPHVVLANEQRRKTLLESSGTRISVTDSIIATMLSQNTTDKNSKAAFHNLKTSFSSWEAVLACKDIAKVERAIRVAGLAKIRAERIVSMLQTVKGERGTPSLDYLRDMSDEAIKKELTRFKGLGPKTISCVLLFALARPEFPVDTHVLRISKQAKWVTNNSTRESAYEFMNSVVPNEVKLDLHCLLVAHGKHCHRCAANGRPQFPPKDGSKLDCPLVQLSAKAELICQRDTAAGKHSAKKEVEVKIEVGIKEEMVNIKKEPQEPH